MFIFIDLDDTILDFKKAEAVALKKSPIKVNRSLETKHIKRLKTEAKILPIKTLKDAKYFAVSKLVFVMGKVWVR